MVIYLHLVKAVQFKENVEDGAFGWLLSCSTELGDEKTGPDDDWVGVEKSKLKVKGVEEGVANRAGRDADAVEEGSEGVEGAGS